MDQLWSEKGRNKINIDKKRIDMSWNVNNRYKLNNISINTYTLR